MSGIRLYVDEDAAETAVIDGLRQRGMDVVSVFDAAMASATDEEQLAFALADNRTLYSLNVGDFCRLHNQWLADGRHHLGIILITRQQISVGEKIRRIDELATRRTAEEMVDRIEFL